LQNSQAYELVADLLQMALDLAGIFDATGLSDALGALLSAARGDYWGAVCNVVSIVPGADAAKLAKIPGYTRTVKRLQALIPHANLSPEFLHRLSSLLDAKLLPLMEKGRGLMPKLPGVPANLAAEAERHYTALLDACRRLAATVRQKLDSLLHPTGGHHPVSHPTGPRPTGPRPTGPRGDHQQPTHTNTNPAPNAHYDPLKEHAGGQHFPPNRKQVPPGFRWSRPPRFQMTGRVPNPPGPGIPIGVYWWKLVPG